MILNETKMFALADKLLQMQNSAQSFWRAEENAVFLNLPNKMTVCLLPNLTREELLMQVRGINNEILGEIDSKNYPIIRQIYDWGRIKASDQLFSEIMDSLVAVNKLSPVDLTTSRITEAQKKQILELISGNWIFNYGRDTDNVRITSDGHYFNMNSNQAVYKLNVMAWNAEKEIFEVAKVRRNGVIHQIEQLSLDSLVMTGIIKHSGQIITYTRMP